jgi:hypothetical protein
MHEEMITYVRQHDPVSSRELAEQFLKFKSPIETMAHAAIAGILGTDKRCYFGDDKLWHGAVLPAEGPAAQTFSDNRFVAVFLLSLSRDQESRPVHVSVWTVDEIPELLHDAWLEDPDLLPQNEQEVLRSVRDRPYETNSRDKLLSVCENKIPVFMSSRDLLVFTESIAPFESRLTEDSLVISTLLRCAKVPVPRPLTIDACSQTLFGTTPVLSYAYKYGESLANCVRELFSRMSASGISGLPGLEASEKDGLSAFDFSQKGFCRADITDAPALPGVYGFKTKGNDFLYIGKASSLRRRLMSYFRESDESPEKIARIRSESYGLITSVCGSELESLVYEYRLIKKHRPVLNTHVAINERKGDYRPIDDCIIMLPHADADKGMSFLFRKSRKILLRPFFSDFRDAAALIRDLDGFFFGKTPAPDSEDFPEQEIATRWAKQHQDGLPVVFINRVANAKEACDAMRGVWKDYTRAP